MNARLYGIVCLLFWLIPRPAAQAQCVGDPGERLVVIGHSWDAGVVDSAITPESQRWVGASYIAERLGATYCVPELKTGIALSAVGATSPDFRTLRFLSPDDPPTLPIPVPVPPFPSAFKESPYFGLYGLAKVDQIEKLRPEELHTNLAVAGATLAGVLTGTDVNEVIDFRHQRKNGKPYFELDPPRLSQLEIALYLQPKWVIVNIGANDLSRGVAPADFEKDYRSLISQLRSALPQALIVCLNVPNHLRVSPGYMTASEADPFFGLAPGTLDQLFLAATGGAPAATDLFSLSGLALALYGASPPAPITASDLATFDANQAAYNQAILQISTELGAVYVDVATFQRDVRTDGHKLTIDGTAYSLTGEYGGGYRSFDGDHLTKTGHALVANLVIGRINAQTGSNLPLVDVDAVACSDLHIRRAFGLPESGYQCPEPQPIAADTTGGDVQDADVLGSDSQTPADATAGVVSGGAGCRLAPSSAPPVALLLFLCLGALWIRTLRRAHSLS